MRAASRIYLGVALDGAGWHPAAWRAADARPHELFTARYWADLVQEAERGQVGFVTFEDGLSLQSSSPGSADARVDQVRGRLDAVLVASRVAPLTSRVGLVPTVVAAHTEPFHVSKAIATLDFVSRGRAGALVKPGNLALEAGHFGRRPQLAADAARGLADAVTGLVDETADYVEVVRRLWDSWEDGAEIRDAATGRFIDRHKLHYIDFEGKWFSVRGPSITPRPPQGQPLVSVLAEGAPGYRLAVRSADLVYITPESEAELRLALQALRAEQSGAGRDDGGPLVLLDLVVFLDADAPGAARRKASLDELAGVEAVFDAHVFVGAVEELADLLVFWHDMGVQGFRLRPGSLPRDLLEVTRVLVPSLQRRGVYPLGYEAATLREAFGMERPPSRFAAAGAGTAGSASRLGAAAMAPGD